MAQSGGRLFKAFVRGFRGEYKLFFFLLAGQRKFKPLEHLSV